MHCQALYWQTDDIHENHSNDKLRCMVSTDFLNQTTKLTTADTHATSNVESLTGIMLRPTHAQCGRNVYAGCGSEHSNVAPARTYVCLEKRTVNTTKLRSFSWNEPPACAHASNYIRALRLPRSQTNATHRMKRCRERQTQSLGVEICSSCLRQLMLTHVRQE